jgi:hypothetical protein
LGDINYYVSDGLGDYHAFQATVEKRLSSGLTALVGYTWAHSIDDVATDFGGGRAPRRIRGVVSVIGNSAFDIRQRFTASFTWRLLGFSSTHLLGTAWCSRERITGSSMSVLVRPEEECSLVREGRRKLDHLEFTLPEVHHGRIG